MEWVTWWSPCRSRGQYLINPSCDAPQVPVGGDGHPELCAPPVSQLLGDLPLQPQAMGALIPQQINIWMGHTAEGMLPRHSEACHMIAIGCPCFEEVLVAEHAHALKHLQSILPAVHSIWCQYTPPQAATVYPASPKDCFCMELQVLPAGFTTTSTTIFTCFCGAENGFGCIHRMAQLRRCTRTGR